MTPLDNLSPAAAVPSAGDDRRPMYARIAVLLRERMRRGQLAAGARLATIDELMAEFASSRVTVRQALGLLADDGLIRRQRGRGTFVTQRAANLRWISLRQDWRELVDDIRATSPKLLSVERHAVPPETRSLEGHLAPAYCLLTRVHSRAGVAFALLQIYLDQACYDLAPGRFDEELVIPLLEELPAVTIASAHQSLTIASAEPLVAEHLGLALGAPVGHLRRVIFDDGGQAIYIGDLVYRGDLIRMEMTLDVGAG